MSPFWKYLREESEKKMLQKVGKVHNFLDAPLPQDDLDSLNLGKIEDKENFESLETPPPQKNHKFKTLEIA